MNISVIIPCYNAAKFIGECIDSVVAQSRPPYEVIVVDDGSTDSSMDVVHKAGIAVRVIETNRRGGAGARNAGIQAAAGDWIAFLDADDIWFPNHLKRAVEVINRTGAVGYINHYDHIRSDGLHVRKSKVKSEVIGTGLDDYIALFIRYGHFVGMSACMVQAQRVREVGGFLESQLRRHDIEFWLRVVQDRRWVFDPEATSAYRKFSPGSLSAHSASAAFYGFTAFLRHRHKARDLAAYDAILRERARSAIVRSFGNNNDNEALERAYSIAFEHLGPMHRIIFGFLRQYPGLFPICRWIGLV